MNNSHYVPLRTLCFYYMIVRLICQLSTSQFLEQPSDIAPSLLANYMHNFNSLLK